MDPAAAVLGDVDLLREVLARLPAPEDLVRAAAACRLFLRAARDRTFLHRFRRRHPASCPRVLGCLFLHPLLERPDYRRPPFFLACSPSPSPAAAAAYGADASLSFVPLGPLGGFGWDILDCRNGLVLLRNLLSQELAFADPVVRGWIALPRTPAKLIVGYGLFAADDADSSVFCVVCVSRDPASRELRALVLSSGSEWADVAGVPCQLDLAASTAMQANRSLYWRLEGGERMLAFSTATRELSVLELPPSLRQISFGVVEKGEEGGDVLHLLTMRGFCIEVWAGTRDDASESGMAWRQVEKSVRFYREVAAMINHPVDLNLDELEVVCVASGVVFLRLWNHLFSIDLETMKLRMITKESDSRSLPLAWWRWFMLTALVYPYTIAWPPSFLTPGQGHRSDERFKALRWRWAHPPMTGKSMLRRGVLQRPLSTERSQADGTGGGGGDAGGRILASAEEEGSPRLLNGKQCQPPPLRDEAEALPGGVNREPAPVDPPLQPASSSSSTSPGTASLHSTGDSSPMDDPSDTNCGGNQTPLYPPYSPTFQLDRMPPHPDASHPTPYYMPPVYPPSWPNLAASQPFMDREPAPPIPPASDAPIATPPPRRTRKTICKRTSSRGPSYTIAEDRALCSAYLNVSRDPIVGAGQTSETYWERIAKYYNENNKFKTPRTPDSLQTRWQTIQKDTARFCAIKAEVDRRRESGKTEEDWVNDALELFQGRVGKQFQFKHCWDILRNSRKWEDWIAGKAPESGGERDEQNAEEDEDMDTAPAELRQPIGSDKAKKKRRSEGGGSSDWSACLELFKEIARDRDQRSLDIKAIKERQLAIQEERNRRVLELQEEKFRFNKQKWETEQEFRQKQWETEQEERIMNMDLSTLHGAARDYYALRQREILKRRGEGSTNDGKM